MQWFSAATIALCMACLLSAPSGAQPQGSEPFWPQWRGPHRDGISTEKGLLQDWTDRQPSLVWMADGFGRGYASVAVVGRRIYTTGNVDRGQAVIAADAADGRILWTSVLTDGPPGHSRPGSRCTPTVDGDRIYVTTSGSETAEIVCLEAADGRVVWRRSFREQWGGRMMSGWGYAESPLVDGPYVACTPGGPDAMMVKLDKQTGREIWRAPAPRDAGPAGRDGAGYSSIMISQGAGVRQYVTLVGRGVIGVRASDGRLLWCYNRVANRTANIPTVLVRDDYVFCSAGYRDGGSALLRLKPAGDGVSAEEVYYKPANELQNHHGQMILVGDYVYMGHGHNNGFPVCVELLTGRDAWRPGRGPGRGSAAVVYADGCVLFRYQDGPVALVEATPEAYRLKGVLQPAFQEDMSWAQPVVAGGRLYLREQDKLMCYDVQAAP